MSFYIMLVLGNTVVSLGYNIKKLKIKNLLQLTAEPFLSLKREIIPKL